MLQSSKRSRGVASDGRIFVVAVVAGAEGNDDDEDEDDDDVVVVGKAMVANVSKVSVGGCCND